MLMQVSKEIEELNDVLRRRLLSGIWNLNSGERQSDPKTCVQAHLEMAGSVRQPAKAGK